MNNKIILARNLRKNATIQERRLWNLLKNRQFRNLKIDGVLLRLNQEINPHQEI